MNSARYKVIDALHVLSSKDAQYDLLCRSEDDPQRERSLNLAHELWRSWIEEVYLPHHSDFSSEFPSETLIVLERFTEFFKARLPLFPPRFESLMTDTHWLSLTEYANVLLERLARDDALLNKDG